MAEAPIGKELIPSTDGQGTECVLMLGGLMLGAQSPGQGMDCVLTLGDLRELVQELEPIKEWFTIGLYLGLKDDELREIEADHHYLQRCKHEVLSRWLRKGDNCTWRRVMEVLMQMGEMVVADVIKLKYLTLTTGPQTASVLTNPMVDAVARRNLIMIRGKWGDLVAHTDEVLQDKLDNKEITNNRFRHVLVNLYSCEGKMNGNQFVRKLLRTSSTVSEMFETLTLEGAWDYLNYYPLECIIEKFGNDSTKKMMEQYKRDLTGYMLVTTIKDHLDAVDMEHPPHRILPIPQEYLFSQLTLKVKAKITDHSLKYVRDVWGSLAELFSLPILTLLLHKIAKGCLEITWHVPSELAAYVIQRAQESEDYFNKQQFLRLTVDGVNIYPESEAVVEVTGKKLPVPHMRPMSKFKFVDSFRGLEEPLRLPHRSVRQVFDDTASISSSDTASTSSSDTASTASSDSGIGMEKPLRVPHPRVRQVFDDTSSTSSSDSGIRMEKPLQARHVRQVHSGVGIKMPLQARHVRQVHSGVGIKMPLHLEQPSMSTEGSVKWKDTTSTKLFPQMRWETLRRAPEWMRRGATTVDRNTIYITPGYGRHVWAYYLKADNWTRLPDCPQCNAGLAMVNGVLTAVGGSRKDGNATNTLMSLIDSRRRWTEQFPPMPVKLNYLAVVCTGKHLLVTDEMNKLVYVMDTSSLKWSSAGSLPMYVFNPSFLVCGTELYMLNYSGSVFSCSLPTLLQSSSAVQPETTEVWQKLASVPVQESTLTTLHGQLVAAGGYNVLSEPADTIQLYDPSIDSWYIIGHMPTARYHCTVATLPGDTLVVIGGVTRGGPCDVVEVAYPV